ncbi:DNA-3-methyladenine glycosylase I [Alloprevotella rava]|uniref:DNA-3-methyladenine glycosylase I n=1 Tax=Alloprevotella rava TaxID=671218 RepID=A0A7W5YFS5_9BACT|nr:DNA-3-methyladenine glycosylase I [Alloprevotella rava]MBB3702431.1 DNA-3-methyladenine glycosylase I [Alloprevotella rava]
MEKTRCQWGKALEKDFYRCYHDEEWGLPLHDDHKHYEFLVLECMSCGLSWELILRKREILRRCFAEFDAARVAAFTEADMERIIQTEGMIRSRRKVKAMISNAQAFLKVQQEFGSFDRYIWSFTNGKTFVYPSHAHTPATHNALSDLVAKDLKQRGFKFVGTVIIYSHLQAIGIINDHLPTCFRFAEVCQQAEIEMQEQ